MRAWPSVQKLWEEKKDEHLHVFLPYVQGDSRDEVVKFLGERGWTAPVPYSRFPNYPGTGSIPYAYVIGPDGKVVFEGNSGYEPVIEEQLKRIKYPGLGKLDVAPDVAKAAQLFVDGNYVKAREEATKQKEKKADEEAVVADADFILSRIEQTATRLQEKAQTTREARRYHETVRALEALAKGFKGDEIGEKADEELKALKKDKEIKDELKAWDALEKTLAANEKMKDAASKKKSLEMFAAKYEGTAAADEARKLYGQISG